VEKACPTVNACAVHAAKVVLNDRRRENSGRVEILSSSGVPPLLPLPLDLLLQLLHCLLGGRSCLP
jgi:hypothetical protein